MTLLTKSPTLLPVLSKVKVQNTVTDTSKWYAIYTKSRFEKKLYSALLSSGFEVFLPLIKEKRKWSDRLKTVVVPLLPSYVFVKMLKTRINYLYNYEGVVRLVSFEGRPCEIREEEIALLERIVTHGYHVQTTPLSCQRGDVVRIIRGPLKGWEGRVEGQRGNSRIVFQFTSLQQCLSVEVDLRDVEKVG
jgi:transcriptional antiterminator RfaH